MANFTCLHPVSKIVLTLEMWNAESGDLDRGPRRRAVRLRGEPGLIGRSVPMLFPGRLRVTLVDGLTYERLRERQRDDRLALTLSAIGLNRENDEALVYLTVPTEGWWILLRRRSDGWRVGAMAAAWVS